MHEVWCPIEEFPDYNISNYGRARTDKSNRLLALSENQYGLVHVGLMRDGMQYHRSLPLLVARAFLPEVGGAFDTPINMDGDRHNNRVDNLAWRPRWFAVKYNQQFRYPHPTPITHPIINLKTGEVFLDSLDCARSYGILEEDLISSIVNRTYVWPIYQEFGVLDLDID